ncbi:gamma-glutamylcyclotransferase family protein [Longirhabdus pacifica]|uniref:gamma-glutamylcyclotransferase family protein n=1 Tax=Longirhabdus pacifica TaxID=2305227 RepID=UPI001008E1C2|nr:gamma-glutamylcyclotransferase family protein [Longirhabdus pacifica]
MERDEIRLDQHAENIHKWMKEHYSYYFAYGSCMNRTSFRKTASNFLVIGAAKLPDYKVAFSRSAKKRKGGIADIVHAPNEMMEGVLYFVPNELIHRIDIREHADDQRKHPIYRKINVTVLVDEIKVSAFTYEVIEKENEEVCPHEEYREIIRKGADLLSETYQQKLYSHMLNLRQN